MSVDANRPTSAAANQSTSAETYPMPSAAASPTPTAATNRSSPSAAIRPLRLAVFASGNGSNFQAIADAVRSGRLDARLELLVCDKPQAPVVERARKADIPAFVFRPRDYASREAYEAEILGELEARRIDLVVLAGYMRILTGTLVDRYWGRMINIHPSLLPSFPGLHAVRQALEHGVKATGATVHFVDGGLDSGPIIAQQAVEIQPDDTEESLTARIHAVEHELLIRTIQWIATGRVRIDGRTTVIAPETDTGRSNTNDGG